jgi:sugar transferase (PEP-CTERM/EpsH1 system associated)
MSIQSLIPQAAGIILLKLITLLTGKRSYSPVNGRKITVMHVVITLDMAGAEHVVYNLTKNLNKELFEVIIVVILSRGFLAAEAEKQGIKVILTKKLPRYVSSIYPNKLIRIIKEIKPDIIHSHDKCGHYSFAARLCKVPVVIHTEHGRIFPDLDVLIFRDRLCFRFTDKLVTVSEYLTNYMQKIVGIDNKKIIQIENGVDTKLFYNTLKDQRTLQALGLSQNDNVIGIVARLEPVKDHLTLLSAFAEVVKTVPNCKLLIIGNGSQKQSIEEQIQLLKLSEKVLLLGERRDITDLLAIMDIFVLSSLSEGTSITLLEAMASGKPVVATNVGGNGKVVIDNETGFLVPSRKPAVMAEKIIKLLSNRNLINEMGAKGRNRVLEHFSLDKMVKEYERLYLDSLNHV